MAVERLSGETHLYVKIASGDTSIVRTDKPNTRRVGDRSLLNGEACHYI